MKKKTPASKKRRTKGRDDEDLPIVLRSFIASQLDSVDEFKRRYPKLHRAIFGKVDSPEYRRFEARLETIQRQKRNGTE
jgi:hypothetical protein